MSCNICINLSNTHFNGLVFSNYPLHKLDKVPWASPVEQWRLLNTDTINRSVEEKKNEQSVDVKNSNNISHVPHGTGIFTYSYHKFKPSV